MTGRERIRALFEGKPVDHIPNVPISMMAASDAVGRRYLDYIRDYRVHSEGQLRFAEKYGIDHLSVISCPTVEAESLGAKIIYYDDQPPAVDETRALLAEKSTLVKLKVPDPSAAPRMVKILETARRLKEKSAGEKMVEGWIEGPIAEAADIRGINSLMMDLIDDPGFVRDIFEFLYEVEMAFAREQVKAGAEIIGVGDAAASLIGPGLYRDIVWDYEKRYIDTLHEMGVYVRLHICGNITPLLPMVSGLNADLVDLDSMVSVPEARKHLGDGQVISGNIDPVRVLRDLRPHEVFNALETCWNEAGRISYMAAAGCEVPRDTPPENMMQFRAFAESRS